MGFSGASVIKNPAASEGDMGSIPGLGRSLGGGATDSNILAGNIPWTEEPGRIQFTGGRKERDTTERAHMHMTWPGPVSQNFETWKETQRPGVIGAELVNGSVLETEDTRCSSTNSCSCLDSTLPLTFYQLPRWLSGKEYPCQCRRHKRYQFHPWVGKILRRRPWQLTPVFFLGESYVLKSLVGYSPKGCNESDMTESTAHWLFTRLLSLLT